MNSIASAASVSSTIGAVPVIVTTRTGIASRASAIVFGFLPVLVAIADGRNCHNEKTRKNIKLNIASHTSLRFALETKQSKFCGFVQTNFFEAMTK